MNLTINGEEREIAVAHVADLVTHLGMKHDRIAVELNREIVPRDRWTATPLHDGDRLEIVHFVGGGKPLPNCRTADLNNNSHYRDTETPRNAKSKKAT